MAVMFLLLLGLFMTFAAFALDLGNYYLWQLRLDRIARAGALVGIGRRGLDGYTQSLGVTNITTAVTDSVRDNFKALGVTDESLYTATPQYNSFNETIRVEVTFRVPLILIDKITRFLTYGFNTNERPGGWITRISAIQTAALAPSNVVLMVDVSGSMLCPAAGDPTCACRTSPNPNACAAFGQSKLALMAQGVAQFASMFNPNQDRIAFIPFNLAAQRAFNLTQGGTSGGAALNMQSSYSTNPLFSGRSVWDVLTSGGGTDPTATQLTADLTALAGSNTNHADALAEGILELENLSATLYGTTGTRTERQQLQPFVVFFTDGSPNAVRGIFNDSSRICRDYSGGSYSNPRACTSLAASVPNANDMYHYALEWVTALPTTPPTVAQYRGPGPFVIRQVNNGVPSLFRHNIGSTSVAPAQAITCGQHTSNPTTFETTITTITTGGAGRRGSPTTGCLTPPSGGNTFSFSIPNTNYDANGVATGTYYAGVSGVPISTANTTWRDKNWPTSFFSGSPPAYGVQKYDELPYYSAIEAADYLRTRFGATIFTIGLGPSSTAYSGSSLSGLGCVDPLQDADNHLTRKDFFLSRLAFSRNIHLAQDPTYTSGLGPMLAYSFKGAQSARAVNSCTLHRFNLPTGAPTLNVGYTSPSGYTDGTTINKDLRPKRPIWADGAAQSPSDNSRRIDTMGEYFPTNDPTEVPSIFGIIAKTILLRATS